MDEHTAQEKRWKALLASAEWEWFRDEWGIGPNNKDEFYTWALQLGVDPGYWWETREMAIHGFPQSPGQTPSYAQSLGHDAGGHGGGGIVSAAGFAFALLPKEKVLMEDDDEYIKIEQRRKKEWLEKHNRKDFNSPEGIDFLYGSLDDPTKPSLHTDIESEFREKFVKKAEQYDKKKKRVHRNIDNDPALQAVQERIETHAASRHALAKLTDENASYDDVYKRVERNEFERFVTKHPEKVRAYVLGKEGKKYPELARAYDTVQTKEVTGKEIRHIEKAHPPAPTISQEETTRRLEKILAQPPQTPSGLVGPTGVPLPTSLPQQPPPPTAAQQQQQEPGGGQSASRAGQAFRKWRAAQAAKKAEGEAAKAIVKKAFWRLPGFWFASGIAGMIILLIVLLFSMGAPLGGPGGPGGTQSPTTGGDIASCTFYRGGDATQGYKFRIREWPTLINDVSSKVGVPASIIAGILRVKTPDAFYTQNPTYTTNDVDDHFSRDENGNPVAYGVMQFTPATFKGTFDANRAEMQSLFGKTEISTKFQVDSLADVEPNNLLRIYSVRDSVIATAYKVKSDKKSINGDGPWDETTVKEITRRYYDACNYYQGGKINSYCDDLWKSYSGCITSSTIAACSKGVSPSLTVEEITIGQSFNGRPIQGYKMGNGSSRIAVVGGMNGTTEQAGIDMVDTAFSAFKNGEYTFASDATLYFLPLLNPDSKFDGSQDWNGNGVDINRNFDSSNVPGGSWNSLGCSRSRYQRAGGEERSCGDSKNTSQIFNTYCSTITTGGPPFYCAERTGTKAFSEPETQAIRDFIVNNQIKAVFSYRAPFNNVTTSNAPSGSKIPKADELAQKMAAWLSIQYESYFRAYPVTGQFMDWLHDIGVVGVEIELPKSPKSDTAFLKKNLEALQNGLNFLVPNNTSSATATSCASSCPLQDKRVIGCGSFMSDPKYNRGICSGTQPIERGHCGINYGCYLGSIEATNNQRRAHSIDIDGPAGEKIYLPTINGNVVEWNYAPSLSYSVAPSDGGGYGHVFTANVGADRWILHLLHTKPPPIFPIPAGRSYYQSGDDVTEIEATSYPHVHVNLGKNTEDNNGGRGWLNPEDLGMCVSL